MLWQENVQFPARCKPLPPGYRIVQLDSGHYQWTWGEDPDDHEKEGFISVDRWWVRRCVFANYAERMKGGGE
jgi:hypothetical protein